MMLRVVYTNGETGLVKACDLDELIQGNQIVAFCRSDGWVRIGLDPVRYMQQPFDGPGKRWSDLALSKA